MDCPICIEPLHGKTITTLLFDLFMQTNLQNNISKELLQTNLILSLYNTIKCIHNLEVDISRLIWYTDHSTKLQNFLDYNQYQQLFIKKNLLKL